MYSILVCGWHNDKITNCSKQTAVLIEFIRILSDIQVFRNTMI